MTRHPARADDRSRSEATNAPVTIGFLVLLVVDLALALACLGGALFRRRTIRGRRGAFKGKLRVAEGELGGFSPNWQSGYGHWVRDILVWNPGPLLLRMQLIAVDGTDASGIRAANGGVKGLGRRAVVVPLLVENRRRFELATAGEDHDLALGPFAQTSAVGSLVRARSGVGHWDHANEN